MKDAQFNKLFVFICSLVPAVMIAYDFVTGQTTDPPRLLRNTGICTLTFLALSLLITPLRRLTGKNHWSLYRRMLGLYAFFYCCLHVLIFIFIREGHDWPKIWTDATAGLHVHFDDLKWRFAAGAPLADLLYYTFQKMYILIGIIAFTLMIPLAATSTTWSIKKMGNKKWKLLHKLVYITAICASAHYLLTGKFAREPLKLTFAAIFATLLLFRLAAWTRDKYFPAPKPPRPAPTPKPTANQSA